MFDRQAEELKELMKDENQTQLKELYDSLDEEDKAKEREYEQLKAEMKQIQLYLDTYGIPRKNGSRLLSVLERLSVAMGEKVYA